MLTPADCQVIEGQTAADEAEFYAAVQRAINAGAWSWQGHYGRTMMAAIKAGDCLLGRAACDDAYGHPIHPVTRPGRTRHPGFLCLCRHPPRRALGRPAGGAGLST
jgi:hypothetical protein